MNLTHTLPVSLNVLPNHPNPPHPIIHLLLEVLHPFPVLIPKTYPFLQCSNTNLPRRQCHKVPQQPKHIQHMMIRTRPPLRHIPAPSSLDPPRSTNRADDVSHVRRGAQVVVEGPGEQGPGRGGVGTAVLRVDARRHRVLELLAVLCVGGGEAAKGGQFGV